METGDFLLVAVFILGYGAVSGRLERSPITAPMVFTSFGILVGSDALGLLEVEATDRVVITVMELALTLVLFTDASRIHLATLVRGFRVPLRLLGVGLPLTVIGGTVAAVALFPAFSWGEALVLAVVLAPTDAALGQVVVSSDRVPVVVRQTLNVESGLNDGLALPLLAIALAVAGAEAETGSAGFWTTFALEQVLVALIVGALAGYLGGRIVRWGTGNGWMSPTFHRLSALGIALVAFGAAHTLGGSGFIAAFVAGLVLGNTAREVCGRLYDFAEAEGQLLTLLTFLLFGAAMVGPAVRDSDWRVVAYVALSLTVVRLLPVALALAGAGLRASSVAFIGWFGPRGIASILFGLVVLEEGEFAASGTVFTAAVVAVLVSVFAHGISALPAANRYGAAMRAHHHRAGADVAEYAEVPEMPVRMRMPAHEHRDDLSSS